MKEIFNKIQQTEVKIDIEKFKFQEIESKVKDFELKGIAGNIEYENLMHTNICNIDTLLDTKSELEKIY